MMRYDKLDAIRGIAAAIVVANHAFNLVPGADWDSWLVQWTPLGRLISGDVAVAVFFVLSGFVLTIPLTRDHPPSYGMFVLRRFLRIYPPFAIAVAISACFVAWLAFPKPAWALHDSDWSTPVTWLLLSQHLGMLGIGYGSISLNPPMWTLIQELRIALLLPFLVLLLRRFKLAALVAIAIVAHAATKLTPFQSFVGANWRGTLTLTIYFTYFFAVGSAIYLYRDRLMTWFARPPLALHAIVVLGLAFMPRHLLPSFLLSQAEYALLAGYSIVLCLTFPSQLALLDGRVLQWLGRVSYSLYLIHVPIMLATKYLLYPQYPIWVIVAIAVVLSLILAEVFHRLVEAPAIRLSHLLTATRRTVSEAEDAVRL